MTISQRVRDVFGRKTDNAPTDATEYELTGSYSSPEEGDAKILESLLQAGADLRKPRHVILYLFFPTYEAALEAARHLDDKDYETHVYQSKAETMSWVVRPERTGIVDEEHVCRERELMSEVSHRFGGEFDGWEASQIDAVA